MHPPFSSNDDSLLHTPIVTLSPTTEISKLNDEISNSVRTGSLKIRIKKKKLRSWKVRNVKRLQWKRSEEKKCSSESETDDLKKLKLCSNTESNGSSKKHVCIDKEQFSLQIQRAMIADEDGDRPIHIAVAQEDVPLVQRLCYLLKKANTSIDLINYLRQTPLHVAVAVGNKEIVEILLRHGASAERKDRHGKNVLHLAVKYFKADTFTQILAHCTTKDVLDACDYDGYSPLHYALNLKNTTAVDELCRAGANVNATDGKSGRSCLAHAVLAGRTDLVILLLQHGADVEQTDYYKQTVLELSLHTGDRYMINLLEKRCKIKTATISDSEEPKPTKRLKKSF